MGFWVAMTKKGAVSLWVSPSMVHWRSSIASRSADWVFGGDLLISSARRMFVNIGPFSRTNLDSVSLQTLVPRMSAAMRSGVNWIRRQTQPVTLAKVLARRVFPRPGKSSKSMWPLARLAASIFLRRNLLPTK